VAFSKLFYTVAPAVNSHFVALWNKLDCRQLTMQFSTWRSSDLVQFSMLCSFH